MTATPKNAPGTSGGSLTTPPPRNGPEIVVPSAGTPIPRGRRECVCGGCRRVFGGVAAFDTHQTLADGLVCHAPESRGLVVTDVRADGIAVWGRPYKQAARANAAL